MNNIIFSIIFIILVTIAVICIYQTGKIDGKQEVKQKFLYIMQVMDDYFSPKEEECRKNGNHVLASEYYGKMSGAAQMMLLYYGTEKKESKDEHYKKNSLVQLLLSEMQAREFKGDRGPM